MMPRALVNIVKVSPAKLDYGARPKCKVKERSKEGLLVDGERNGLLRLLDALADFRNADEGNVVSLTRDREWDSTLQKISGHIHEIVGRMNITLDAEVMTSR